MTTHAPSGPILELYPVLFWRWMTTLYGPGSGIIYFLLIKNGVRTRFMDMDQRQNGGRKCTLLVCGVHGSFRADFALLSYTLRRAD